MMSDELANYLDRRGVEVKRHGTEFRAPCPVHDDPSPSCGWRDGDAARILLLCRAGCETQDVIEAWGLTMADLFHDADDPRRRDEPAPANLPSEDDLRRAVERLHGSGAMLDRLDKWRHWHDRERLRKLGVGLTDRGRLVFPVRRGDGALVGVTEYDPDPARSGPKSISTGRRDLWPTPEFHRDGDLWLVEGEADAITALMLGYTASAVPGAQYWSGRRGLMTAQRLQGRPRVFVCADCDEPGREWARRAASDLANVGALDVRLVDLDPTRADGWDITALLHDAGGNEETARRFVNDVAKHAARVRPTKDAKPDVEGWPSAMSDEAYIGIARRIVAAYDPITEADRAAILVSVLAAFGNLVGRDPHMILDGSRHTCALYVLVVGQSAKSRKGTSWNRAAEIMQRADPQWFESRIVGGLSSGEGLVFEVRDPVYERVRKRDGSRDEDDETVDDDGSGYVETVVDPGVEDKRLLVVETEFAQPLRVLRRESNILSANLRNLWDRGTGGALTKHSRTRATNAHVSIVGHITAEELRREMTETSMFNGFANRFVFVCARRSKRLAGGGALDDWTRDEFGMELATAAQWASKVYEITFDPDAWALYESAYNGELAVEHAGPYGAITARGEPMVCRLSMIYALLDGASIIRPQHIRAGLAVWRYCDASARYLFANIAPGFRDGERLRAILLDHPEGMTRSELSAAVGRNWPVERINQALDYLRGLGFAAAERMTPDAVGKPGERWKAT